MKIAEVNSEVIMDHFMKFFPSLRKFPEKYLPIVSAEIPANENHLAYLCPLCLKHFITLEPADTAPMLCVSYNSPFSLEHIPPKSVNAMMSLLECKKCNNDAGGLYDSALIDKLQFLSFDNRIASSKIDAKFTMDGIIRNYPGFLEVSKDGDLEINFKPTNENYSKPLDEWVAGPPSTQSWEAQIVFKFPDEGRVSKAMMKIAYLMCFYYWGYDFIFSRNGELIRGFLNDQIEYPSNVPVCWFRNSIIGANIPRFPLGLCQIVAPIELKSFVVNIPLTDKETGFTDFACVLIPNPTDQGWQDIKRTSDLMALNGDGPLNISLEHVVCENYSESWDKLVSR